MRILIAEDDPGIRDLLVLGLEEQGYQVDAVDRGDDAIDMLKFYEYDVAVLDWRMPGAEGVEVVRWARRNARPTAILMLTARTETADRVAGLDAGANGVGGIYKNAERLLKYDYSDKLFDEVILVYVPKGSTLTFNGIDSDLSVRYAALGEAMQGR